MKRNLIARRAFLSSGLVIGSALLPGAVIGQGPGGAGAGGQGPGQAQPIPAANPADVATDQYLQRWEKAMSEINSLVARLKLSEDDKVFNNKQKYLGIAKYAKVGAPGAQASLALLELVKEQKPTEVDKKFICTGTYLYEIQVAKKQITAHEMPKPKPGQVGDDNFLLFLFGMKAQEVKRRYKISLVKEDDWYGYFDIYPLTPQDKADFQRSRLVLYRQTALPRMVWFERPNGDETMWDIENIDTKAPVSPNDFQAPIVPMGWTTKVNQLPQGNGPGPARMPRGNP